MRTGGFKRFVGKAAAAALFTVAAASAPAQYLMIGDSAGTTTVPSGVARIMLFSEADGSLVDANFISNATSPYTFTTPKEAVQVGNEIWISDQVANAVFCFTATYDPPNSIYPVYIRTITGGMSNMRGLAQVGSRMYITNTGTASGAPGVAMLVYETSGAYVTSFPVAGSNPIDAAVLGGRLLISDLLNNNMRLYETDGTYFGLFRDNTPAGNIRSAQQVAVFPTGPSGANEVWAAGGGGAAIAGVYRYNDAGEQVAFYNVGLGLKGVYVLGSGEVLFTDQTASGQITGNVRKFTPGVSGSTTMLASGTTAGTGIVPQFISPFTPGPPSPTNPYGAGTFEPGFNQVGVLAGTSTVLTVTATPGTTPASTGLAVNADLSAFGGSASQAFDPVGDNTFTYTLDVPVTQTGGNYNILLTISDAQSRIGAGSLRITIVGAPPTDYVVEVEPNDTKATSQAVTLSPGVGIWGITTGTSTTNPGITSSDNFLVTVPAAPPGIYLNSLVLTTPGTAGHVGSIRGLTQTAGVINAGTDAAVQTSGLTTVPARMSQWYGFGKQEQLHYRVVGASAPATGSEYLATFQSLPVTPTVIPVNFGTDSDTTITIERAAGNTQTLDLWVYDANYEPVPSGGYEGTTMFTRTLAPGAYYLALSNTNVANNQATPADSPNRASAVLDYPDSILNNSSGSFTSTPINMNVSISHAGGTHTLEVGKTFTFEIMWFKFYVGSPQEPQVDASADPNPVIASDTPIPGGGATVLSAAITPGNNPPSTGIRVFADLQPLGGASNFELPRVFGETYATTLPIGASQAPGSYSIGFTVTDAQGRSNSVNSTLTVLAAPPAGFVLEAEPNDFKLYATPASIASGQGVYGYSTGNFQASLNDDNPDYFLIETAAAAPAIYRHRMILSTSGIAGHTGVLRGLRQTDGVISPTIDSAFQTSMEASSPPRFNQWYGFGRQELMYYRVYGNGSTTQEYISTLESERITPIVVPGTIPSGSITISRGVLNVSSPDMWLYDAALQPIAEGGSQGNAQLTRTLPAGTYYLAVSDVNTANDQPSPPDSASRGSDVLELPDAIANNSSVGGINMSMTIEFDGGNSYLGGIKEGPFDIVWFQFTLADGAFCPADFNGDGGVDGSDVEAFFLAWENGDPTADVNLDGGIDGSDVEAFFLAWEAGGC
ncbi:MAG: hypothetical protein JNK25_00730 [Phycisphaerae bacterium]|nr:hypothetical protein [Phycisphaerae bacterium]